MTLESFLDSAFAGMCVGSIAWIWWNCRRTPEEEAELAELDRGLQRKQA